MEDRNNKTCSELIRDKLNERIADFKQALRSYEENNYEKIVTENDYEYEDIIDWVNNYVLGYYDDNYYRAKRLELSCGGPQDYFLYFPSDGLIEYHYLDWFDGASLVLDGEAFEVMSEIFKLLGADEED